MTIFAPIVAATPSAKLLQLQKELDLALQTYARARIRRDQVATALQNARNELAQIERERTHMGPMAPALIARHEDKIASLREAELEARANIRTAQHELEAAAQEVAAAGREVGTVLSAELDPQIAEQVAIAERAAAEMMRSLALATELARILGRGAGARPVFVPHPFPTPQNPHRGLADPPPAGEVDAVVRPWRSFRKTLKDVESSWQDLPPQAAAE